MTKEKHNRRSSTATVPARNSVNLQTKYDRIAAFYDFGDIIPERLFYRAWRRRLWGKLSAERILEIGVGTGKNISFYPPGAQVTAIDISPKMLKKAVRRATPRQDVSLELLMMDANELSFDEHTFDAVVGTFMLMVQPDSSRVLQEIKRVCKPGGRLLLLEFLRNDRKLVAFLQDLFTSLTRAIYHAHLNRNILTLIENSGFKIVATEAVGGGLVKIIEAITP